MPRRLPGLGAIVCIAAIAGVAYADRRPVAVIDLTGGGDGAGFASFVTRKLSNHPDLTMAGSPTVQAALVGPLLDEDGPHLVSAASQLATATQAIEDIKFADADAAGKLGEGELLLVTPSAAAKPYADLAFARGLAELGAGQGAASAELALAARLDPGRQPDPGRYTPDVIRAYVKASTAATVKQSLAITGSGRAWIDGVAVGDAPGTFQVTTGRHIVQITGDDRETRGAVVDVVAAQAAKVAIDDAPADEVLAIKRMRLRLAVAAASDAAAEASAIQHLAALLEVGDVVLITAAGDKLSFQTWRDQAPGLSGPRVVRASDQPGDLLEGLAPTRKVEEVPPPPIQIPKKIVVEPPWYRKTWVQGSIAAGIIAVAVSIIVISTEQRYVVTPGNADSSSSGMETRR